MRLKEKPTRRSLIASTAAVSVAGSAAGTAVPVALLVLEGLNSRQGIHEEVLDQGLWSYDAVSAHRVERKTPKESEGFVAPVDVQAMRCLEVPVVACGYGRFRAVTALKVWLRPLFLVL